MVEIFLHIPWKLLEVLWLQLVNFGYQGYANFSFIMIKRWKTEGRHEVLLGIKKRAKLLFFGELASWACNFAVVHYTTPTASRGLSNDGFESLLSQHEGIPPKNNSVPSAPSSWSRPSPQSGRLRGLLSWHFLTGLRLLYKDKEVRVVLLVPNQAKRGWSGDTLCPCVQQRRRRETLFASKMFKPP